MRRRALTAGTIALVALVLVCAAAAVAPSNRSVLDRLAMWATAVGPVVVAASALLIIAQVREAANTVRAQLFDATAGRMLDLSRLFVDKPELRPLFYQCADPEDVDEPLRSSVYATAELHIDFLDTELLRRRLFGPSLGGVPGIDPGIRGLLRSSPAMCRLLTADAELEENGWYDDIHRLHTAVCAAGEAAWVPAPHAQRLSEMAFTQHPPAT